LLRSYISLEPAKVTRGIDALAKQSRVLRREGPEDRRRTILTFSAKRRRLHDEIEQVSRAPQTGASARADAL